MGSDQFIFANQKELDEKAINCKLAGDLQLISEDNYSSMFKLLYVGL